MTRTVSIVLVLGVLAALFAVVAVGLLSANGDMEDMRAELSITNLTGGQILSPVFITRHDGTPAHLYSLGQPASESLARMAEDADAGGLIVGWNPDGNSAISESQVLDLAGGPIPPGQTVKLEFDLSDGNRMVSFVSMLVTTNDAFIGANGLDISRNRTMNLIAYDAGSEVNSEDCQFIPGPPCGNQLRDAEGAEGFVYVHPGIIGGAGSDLDRSVHDWRNPVARLTVRTTNGAEGDGGTSLPRLLDVY